ncbi:two-pore potassium channel 1 [Phtheirospermum japonicum]|uniref:Two-pore potassium channel 1 n=1 Tax=Phtheirospermum japonicum TaxID=374723 RepID=A0A830B5A3_9LAMI|nr:two-pore potassium channel 1 [Phtheirospermum japonicum]
MAKNDAENPLLEQPFDSSHHSNQTNVLTKRKLSRRKNPTDQISNPEQNYISSVDKLNFKLAFVVILAYVGSGALCFFLVRSNIKGNKTNGIIDAVYFCIVTMTTVGYGDLVPDSTSSKFLACVFVFIGMGLIGLLLSKAADTIVENQEIFLVKAIHMRDKCSPAEILKEVETNRVKYRFLTVLFSLLMLVIVGTIFLWRKEGLGLFDAFYCVCATITTLGYGDESFSTSGGRLFAAVWILMSTVCLAQFFYSLAELYTERRRKSFVEWVLSRKLTVSDLEAADLDDDNEVSAAEFVVYKLKEMGKIREDDIAMVMEWFKQLDVDQSGTLTKDDLVNSGPQVLRK